jgi:hypothetical protein
MLTSVSLIGMVRAKPPFAGWFIRTSLRSKSTSFHSMFAVSPLRAPVSLSICRKAARELLHPRTYRQPVSYISDRGKVEARSYSDSC